MSKLFIDITEYIPALTFFWAITLYMINLSIRAFSTIKQKKDKNCDYLIENLFKKHVLDIEMNLFKKIDHNNHLEIINNLICLKNELYKDGVAFYVSSDILFQLNQTIDRYYKNNSLPNSSTNFRYQIFSICYFSSYNKCRKRIGLKKRTIDYRNQNNMFYSKQVKFLEYILLFIIVYIAIPTYILYIFYAINITIITLLK